MSNSILDAIDAEIATLAQIVPLPSGDLGYGVDLSCVTDVTPMLDETDPNSVRGIGEMAIRFLISERGSIPDAPDRGYNIYRLLAKAMSADDIQAEQRAISNEVIQDDRIASADTSMLLVTRTQLQLRVSCVPSDLSLGPFDLIIAIADGETSFDILQQAAA